MVNRSVIDPSDFLIRSGSGFEAVPLIEVACDTEYSIPSFNKHNPLYSKGNQMLLKVKKKS